MKNAEDKLTPSKKLRLITVWGVVLLLFFIVDSFFDLIGNIYVHPTVNPDLYPMSKIINGFAFSDFYIYLRLVVMASMFIWFPWVVFIHKKASKNYKVINLLLAVLVLIIIIVRFFIYG